MSLDKAIEHGKEYREEYRGSKAIDCTCRNHGTCDWCKENRLIHDIKDRQRCDDEIADTLDKNNKKVYYRRHKVMK